MPKGHTTEHIQENSSKRTSENALLWTNTIKSDEMEEIPVLTLREKATLGKQIEGLKKDILSLWLRNKEMEQFYKKYEISEYEVNEYIGYFGGEKILHHTIDTLIQNEVSDSKNYISTKFLSFIKRKKLGIEDLLEIIIVLKNTTIRFFFHEDFKTVNQITEIFDRISTDISKNYNDIVIKLLNEYTNAIDNSNIISKTDMEGVILSVNEEFCRLSGYTKEELIGTPHNIVRHPDMPKEIFRELWATIQDKRIWKGVIKNRTKSGGSYWVKSTVVPILDEHNNIIEYISIRTDITELKEAYKNLEEYTEALNETSMVLKLDAFGKIVSINDIFLKMSCYGKEDLLGKSYIAGLTEGETAESLKDGIPIIQEDTAEEIRACMKQHGMWKGLIKNKTKVGNFFWTSTNIVPILNISDEIMEYVIIQSDVTDLEIAQQELKFSLEKQQELDIKKDEFLNIASHELRTPMTSIKGYLSMILDGDAGEITEEARLYLSQVYKSSQRLLDLINDMLDISKIESGKQELATQSIRVTSLIQEVEVETKGLFIKKHQQFIPPLDLEDFSIKTDSNKLKQVLLNLLGNANKFTPECGTIKLSCQKTRNQLIIAVEDNGIGIEKKDFGKIFEKFGQVKNSLTRDINGTGLGLPIVKAIIEQMGGYINIESEAGKGSKFNIHLPVEIS